MFTFSHTNCIFLNYYLLFSSFNVKNTLSFSTPTDQEMIKTDAGQNKTYSICNHMIFNKYFYGDHPRTLTKLSIKLHQNCWKLLNIGVDYLLYYNIVLNKIPHLLWLPKVRTMRCCNLDQDHLMIWHLEIN